MWIGTPIMSHFCTCSWAVMACAKLRLSQHEEVWSQIDCSGIGHCCCHQPISTQKHYSSVWRFIHKQYTWLFTIACYYHSFIIIFNSLGPSDAIWHWRSWSTLVQVMACCLTTPSYYLNWCWLIISKVLWHSYVDIIIRRFEDTNQ